jgi:hypothetical protein
MQGAILLDAFSESLIEASLFGLDRPPSDGVSGKFGDYDVYRNSTL